MADVSRELFNFLKRYRQVIFQQGRPILDAELNELQDIARYVGTLQAQGGIGNMPYGDGLQVVPTIPPSDGCNVLPGTFYNYGELVESLDKDLLVTNFERSSSETVTSNVYLVWQNVEISSLLDPDLYDQTVNIETAIREGHATSLHVAHSDVRLFMGHDQDAIFLAKVTRPLGVTVIQNEHVEDLRFVYNQNYVKEGLRHLPTTGTRSHVTLSGGEVYVANLLHVLPSVTVALLKNSFNYIWVDGAGEVQTTITKPGPPATLLAVARVDDAGNVMEVVDLRKFIPPLLAWVYDVLRDFLSPKRQHYAGDTTRSSMSSVVPKTVKRVSVYSDPEVALDIREIGFIVRAKSKNTVGKLRILLDGVVKVEHVLPADNMFRIYKSNLTVRWNSPGIHKVELAVWSEEEGTSGTVECGSLQCGTNIMSPEDCENTQQVGLEWFAPGEVVVRLFEAYVKDTSFSRRVNIFGDEGEDIVQSTTMQIVHQSTFFTDPDVALHIKQLSYAGEFKATDSNGLVQIYVDGVLHDEFVVERPEGDVTPSYRVYTGVLRVAWPAPSLHTLDMRMGSTSEDGVMENRMWEIYADQE